MGLTLGQIYLLGAMAMAIRTLWTTRPVECPESGELVPACTAAIQDNVYDLRYLVVATLAAVWPIALACMIAAWLYHLTHSTPEGPDDDDLRPA